MTSPGKPDQARDEDLALLEALPRLPAEEQPGAIERLLRNPSPDVRGPALRVGSAVLSEDKLVEYIREEADDVLRNSGLEMLKLRGAKAVPLGISLLNDRDSDVVLQAVILLDHLRDPRALEALRGILKHPNPNLMTAAIQAIGHVGHAAAARDLFPFLTGDPWFQIPAIEALGALRAPESVEHLAALLSDPMVGPLAAESMVWVGGPGAFRRLAEHWLGSGAGGDAFLELLAHVLEGLTVKPPPVPRFREGVAERLESETEAHRVAAARCLVALGRGEEDSPALRILADAFTDGNNLPACLEERKDLIGCLLGERGVLQTWGFLLAARFPTEVPVEDLAKALTHQVGHEHLASIAQALSEVRGVALGDALLDFYGHLPTDARAGWGPVLRQHGTALLAALERREDLPERTHAVLSAVLVDSAKGVAEALVALSPEYRPEALTHLSEWVEVHQHLPWIEWLQADSAVYGAIAAEAAGEGGLKDLLPDIRDLLSAQPSPDLVRLAANLGDSDAVPVLVSLLKEADSTLHPFVIDALGTIGGTEGRQALRAVIRSGKSRWERLAFMALARCFVEEDVDLFREAVGHPDWTVRLACLEVLGNAGRPEDEPALVQLYADPVPVVAQRAGAVLDR